MLKEKKILAEKVAFLKDVPFLKNLTKTALSKFSYFFKEVTYKRRQIVFSEGYPVKGVYIVKEGEFELAKNMKVENTQKVDFTEFLSQFPHNHENSDKAQSSKERVLRAKHPLHKNVKDNKSTYNVSSLRILMHV